MPRKAKQLTDLQVRRLKHGVVKGKAKNKDAAKHPKGTPCTVLHAVGGVAGLYLQVTPSGARSWILKFRTKAGKNREMGLGPYPEVPLSDARDAARAFKGQAREGKDPVLLRQKQVEAERQEQEKRVTFRELFQSYLKKKQDAITPKGAKQIENTFKRYVLPLIGDRIVCDIKRQDILRVLTQPQKDCGGESLWKCKNTTADQLRSWLDQAFRLAKFQGVYSGDNPAEWKGNLAEALPKPSEVHNKEHFPALPFERTADFVTKLKKREGTAARALELAILCAARSQDVRGARWNELDIKRGRWNISAERMKTGEPHSVPLSDAALTLLKNAPRLDDDLIFPGPRSGKELSDMALLNVVIRMHEAEVKARREGWIDPTDGRRITPHGFRSTFKDWCTEETDTPDFLSEMALAHKVGNEVRQAYQRSDLFAKRLKLMRQWARFIGYPEEGAKVVPMEARA